MVPYFKELEKPNDQYLELIEDYFCMPIDIDNLPTDFFIKYNDLFKKIESYDLLHENGNKKIYTEELPEVTQEQLDWGYYIPGIDTFIYSSFMKNPIFNSKLLTGISKNGMIKLIELKNEYESRYKGKNIVGDFEPYFFAIIDYFRVREGILPSNKTCVYSYLKNARIILKYQGRLTEEDEKQFNEALDYMRKRKIEIEYEPDKVVKVSLPNAWFITPFNRLYNCFGKYGHQNANLTLPLRKIYDGDLIYDYRSYLLDIENILERGYTTEFEYLHYIHMAYKIPSITQIHERCLKGRAPWDYECEEEYEYVPVEPTTEEADEDEADSKLGPFDAGFKDKWIKQVTKRVFKQKPLTTRNFEGVVELDTKVTYDKDIMKIIIGIISAHAGLHRFFGYLKKNSSDYKADLEYLKKYSIDEILVRCCGFHKIMSVSDKTITTSCTNYEEEFAEYINKGWKIDFVEPIILDETTHRLKERDKEFTLIRNMHLENK